MATITITDKPDISIDLDLDDSVEQQILDAIGEDGMEKVSKFEIKDFDGLDSNAFNGFDATVENLVTLGEALDKHSDEDAVCAALIDSDGDPDRIDDAMDRLTWQGKVREDEKDYAQYVIDEGLMTAKSLGPYFDAEKFGSDALMDSRTTVLKDGRIIVWSE